MNLAEIDWTRVVGISLAIIVGVAWVTAPIRRGPHRRVPHSDSPYATPGYDGRLRRSRMISSNVSRAP